LILLPYPPSNNHLYTVARGRKIKSKLGRLWHDLAVIQVKRQMADQKLTKITWPIAVRLMAHPPDRRKRDLDNLPKAALDACTQAGIWGDDSRIQCLTIMWHNLKAPGIAIVVEPCAEAFPRP
jgi:crossover junction endodeoxyribonuclease RusA